MPRKKSARQGGGPLSTREYSPEREVKPRLDQPLPKERGESREPPEARLRRVIEEERRVLIERARLLAEGVIRENYNAFLGLKVRPTIKKLWDAAPLDVKRAAKHALEAAILAYYLGGQAAVQPQLPSTPPIIMNLNIVNARAEARSEASVDIKPLLRLLDKLLRELQFIRNLARFSSDKNARVIYERAGELLRVVELERDRVERLAYN